MQLVRRQTPCDCNAGLPKSLRYNRNLGRSLRMVTNLASFANAFACETGPTDWRIEPFEKLPGGRIIIAVGGERRRRNSSLPCCRHWPRQGPRPSMHWSASRRK